MKIFVDGDEVKAKCDVRIVFEDIEVPNEENGQVHFVFTEEGVVIDIWVPDEAEIERNAGSRYMLVDSIVNDLVRG